MTLKTLDLIYAQLSAQIQSEDAYWKAAGRGRKRIGGGVR